MPPSSSSPMDFPPPSCCFVFPKQLLVFLYLLDCIIFAITLALFYVGLYPYTEAPQTPSWEAVFDFTPANAAAEATEKSLDAIPSSVKRQLPIVELATVLKRSHEAIQGGEPMCAVCLGSLEARDKVRELGNCCHVFHIRCIDQWVDMGKLNCPLCRSQLLPEKTRRGVLWQLQSFFRFFAGKQD